MQNMQEYKCPCCGGAIAFDSTIQKMKCPYCDSEFEMETLQAMDEQLKEGKSDSMEWETKAGGEWQVGCFHGKICGCAQTGSGYPIQAGQESRQRRIDETYFRKTSFTEGFQRSESY